MTGLNLIENKQLINENSNTEVHNTSEETKNECNNIIENPDYKLLANLYNKTVREISRHTDIDFSHISPEDIKFFSIEDYKNTYTEIQKKVNDTLTSYLTHISDLNIFNNSMFHNILKKANNSTINEVLKEMGSSIPDLRYLLKKFDNFKTVTKVQYLTNNDYSTSYNVEGYNIEYSQSKNLYIKELNDFISNILLENLKLFSSVEAEIINEEFKKLEENIVLFNDSNILSVPFIKFFLKIIKLESIPKEVNRNIEDILNKLFIDHIINNTNINKFTSNEKKEKDLFKEVTVARNNDFFYLYIYQIDSFYNTESINQLKEVFNRKLFEHKFNIELGHNIKDSKIKLLINSNLFEKLDSNTSGIKEKILLFLENDKIFINTKTDFKELIEYIFNIDDENEISFIRGFFKDYFNKTYSQEKILFIFKNNLHKNSIIKNTDQVNYIYELSLKYKIDTDILASIEDTILLKIKQIDNPEEQTDLENIVNLIKQGKDVAIYFKNKVTISNFLKELEYLNSNANGYNEIYDLLDNNGYLLTKEPLELRSDIRKLYEKYNIEDSIKRNKLILLDKDPETFTPILNFIFSKFNKLINKKDLNNKSRNKIIKDIFYNNESTIFFIYDILTKIEDKKIESYEILNSYISMIINNKHRIFTEGIDKISFEIILKDINIFGENLKQELENIYGKDNYDFIRNKNEQERINLRDIGKFMKDTGETEDFLLYLDGGEIEYNDIDKITKIYSLFNILGSKLFVEDFINLELNENNINYIWENIEYIDLSKKDINKNHIIIFCSNTYNEEINIYIKELLNIKEEENITELTTTFHNRFLLKKDSLKLNGLKRINSIECIKKIKKLGFNFKNANGSHYKFHKGNRTVIVPFHSEDLDLGMLKSIIVSTGIETIEEWNEL